MYVCMHVCVYVCMLVRACMPLYAYYVCVYMYVCMLACVRLYACRCVYVYVCMYVCMYRPNVWMDGGMHACACVKVCVYAGVCICIGEWEDWGRMGEDGRTDGWIDVWLAIVFHGDILF